RRVVHRDLATQPFAHPDAALAVAPHPPRALPGRRRLDDHRLAARAIDPGDERAGERAVPDFAARRGADAVGAGAARRFLDRDAPALRCEVADEPALTR